jgi:hypothetical protein
LKYLGLPVIHIISHLQCGTGKGEQEMGKGKGEGEREGGERKGKGNGKFATLLGKLVLF